MMSLSIDHKRVKKMTASQIWSHFNHNNIEVIQPDSKEALVFIMLSDTDYATITLQSLVKAMYNVPRNGRTRNISKLFSNDSELRSDYISGVIFVFAILMIAAVVWFMVLIFLRILDHRVGCASGRPTTIPAEPMSEGKGNSVATDESGEFVVMQDDQNRVNRTRIVFIFSVVGTLIFCGFLGFSLYMLQSPTTELYSDANTLKEMFSSVSDSYDTFFFTSTNFESSKQSLLTDLSDFCQTSNGNVNGQDPVVITEALQNALSNFEVLESNDEDWVTLKSVSSVFSDLFGELSSMIRFFKGPIPIWLIVITSAGIVIILLTLYLLVCAWDAGQQGYTFVGDVDSGCNDTLLHKVAIPFYALLIAGCWVLASALFTGSVIVSDFCVGEITNGDMFLAVVESKMGNQTSELFYNMTENYLHNCADNSMSELLFASAYETKVELVKSTIASFIALNVNDLDAACPGDAQAVMSKVQSANIGINALYEDFSSVFPSCDKVASVIQPAIYENGCNLFVGNLVRLFSASLPLAVFGTILITLRSAVQRPLIYLVNDGRGRRNNIYDEESFY